MKNRLLHPVITDPILKEALAANSSDPISVVIELDLERQSVGDGPGSRHGVIVLTKDQVSRNEQKTDALKAVFDELKIETYRLDTKSGTLGVMTSAKNIKAIAEKDFVLAVRRDVRAPQLCLWQEKITDPDLLQAISNEAEPTPITVLVHLDSVSPKIHVSKASLGDVSRPTFTITKLTPGDESNNQERASRVQSLLQTLNIEGNYLRSSNTIIVTAPAAALKMIATSVDVKAILPNRSLQSPVI